MSIGFPDFYKSTISAHNTPRAGQEQIVINAEVTVLAGATQSYTLYTVPSSKRVFVGFIKASCEKSCIQLGRLLKNGADNGSYYFDVGVWIEHGPIGSPQYAAGDTVGLSLINNDVVDLTFVGQAILLEENVS